jgi:hypothetical protein
VVGVDASARESVARVGIEGAAAFTSLPMALNVETAVRMTRLAA